MGRFAIMSILYQFIIQSKYIIYSTLDCYSYANLQTAIHLSKY